MAGDFELLFRTTKAMHDDAQPSFAPVCAVVVPYTSPNNME
jgi:hypothetical protein